MGIGANLVGCLVLGSWPLGEPTISPASDPPFNRSMDATTSIFSPSSLELFSDPTSNLENKRIHPRPKQVESTPQRIHSPNPPRIHSRSARPPRAHPKRRRRSLLPAFTTAQCDQIAYDTQNTLAVNSTEASCPICSGNQIQCYTRYDDPLCLAASPRPGPSSTMNNDTQVCYTATYTQDLFNLGNVSYLTYEYNLTYLSSAPNNTTAVGQLYLSLTEATVNSGAVICHLIWNGQVCNACDAVCPYGMLGQPGFSADCSNVESFAVLDCVLNENDGTQLLAPAVLDFFAPPYPAAAPAGDFNTLAPTSSHTTLATFCHNFIDSVLSLSPGAQASCPTCTGLLAVCLGQAPEPQCLQAHHPGNISTNSAASGNQSSTSPPATTEVICFTIQRWATVSWLSFGNPLWEEITQITYTTNRNSTLTLHTYGDPQDLTEPAPHTCRLEWNYVPCRACSLTCPDHQKQNEMHGNASTSTEYSIDCTNTNEGWQWDCLRVEDGSNSGPLALPGELLGAFGSTAATSPPSTDDALVTGGPALCDRFSAYLHQLSAPIQSIACPLCNATQVECIGQFLTVCVANSTACYTSVLIQRASFEYEPPRQEINLTISFTDRVGQIRLAVTGPLSQGSNQQCQFYWNQDRCTSCVLSCLTSDGRPGLAVDCSNLNQGPRVDCVSDAQDPTSLLAPALIRMFADLAPSDQGGASTAGLILMRVVIFGSLAALLLALYLYGPGHKSPEADSAPADSSVAVEMNGPGLPTGSEMDHAAADRSRQEEAGSENDPLTHTPPSSQELSSLTSVAGMNWAMHRQLTTTMALPRPRRRRRRRSPAKESDALLVTGGTTSLRQPGRDPPGLLAHMVTLQRLLITQQREVEEVGEEEREEGEPAEGDDEMKEEECKEEDGFGEEDDVPAVSTEAVYT